MAINHFRGEHFFLSSMFPLPNGVVGPRETLVRSVEHAYQAEKFEDPVLQARIMSANNGFNAKSVANRLERAGQLIRPDWDLLKVDIMTGYVRQKFQRDIHLAELLLATRDEELIEENNRGDDFWGVCPPGSNNGFNWLGRILMDTRDLIRNDELVVANPEQIIG